jgi:predicted outer membrane repeat protein
MKANIIFVSMIALLTVLTGAMILSGCGNPTGGGGGGGGSSLISHYIWVSTATGSDDAGTGTNEANAYQTIGKALGVARSHTLIRVVDGTYAEHLTWSTFEVVYISGESRDGTIISGEASGRCIYIPSDAATNKTIKIESLTINNGDDGGHGGGIYIGREGITLHLKNVSMTNNSAGAASGGGAIYGVYESDNVIAENCTFEGNSAGNGGAIFLTTGSIPPSGGHLSANNCTFSDNFAALEGGAIYTPNITLEACSLSGNQTTRAGYADSGAAYVKYAGKMTNCLFFNNKVSTTGNDGHGGAMHHETTGFTLNIVNCTFASNEVISSGGGSFDGAIAGNADTNLKNCILWGNIASTNPQLNNTCVVNYSDVQGGYSGTNNVDISPEFAAVSVPYSDPSDLKLTAITTIDVTHGGTKSGAPSKDYAGTARTGHNSMGAYHQP